MWFLCIFSNLFIFLTMVSTSVIICDHFTIFPFCPPSFKIKWKRVNSYIIKICLIFIFSVPKVPEIIIDWNWALVYIFKLLSERYAFKFPKSIYVWYITSRTRWKQETFCTMGEFPGFLPSTAHWILSHKDKGLNNYIYVAVYFSCQLHIKWNVK